jgi:hypothetical protein
MSDDAPRGDMFAAAQMLAADNARLCGIVIAADKLAEVLGWLDRLGGLGFDKHDRIRAVLEAYKIQRQGQ